MPEFHSSTRKRAFYKQTFEIKENGNTVKRHTLLVNPEDMSVDEPARVNPTQTLGGAYVADFGEGLKQVSITGITGYNARFNADGEEKDGYTEFMSFRNEVYRRFIQSRSSKTTMYWYNWEEEEYYLVVPTSFRMMRNKQEPLLFRYQLSMTCLEAVGAGSKPKISANDLDKMNMIALGSDLASGISGTSEARHNMRRG